MPAQDTARPLGGDGSGAPNGGNSGSYGASTISKKGRATRLQMEERAASLIEIAERFQPASVRGIFYQAEVGRVVEKSESGYRKVQRQLVDLRRANRLPYLWIVDNTRWMRKPRTYDSPTAALEHTASSYRRSVMSELDVHVEVWLEKDSLAGVLYPVTSRYDVPLMIAKGYASVTYLHAAACELRELGKPVEIYHFGDYDPSGQNAAEKIEEMLREFAPDTEIDFYRCAVTPEQIRDWELPTRPTKKSDPRAKKWMGGESVEPDAIDPNTLRELCETWIETVIPDDWLDTIRAAEKSEREFLRYWADALAPRVDP